MPEPDGQSTPGMEELVAKAIRPSRQLSVEDLLASELATATLSDSLNKIRHILEGLMLLEPDELKKAGISKQKFEEARKLYALTQTLQNAYINREMISLSPALSIDRYAKISWPFPREKAAEWLDWLGDDFEARYFRDSSDEVLETEIGKLSQFEAIYVMTSDYNATMNTYKGIIIRFINYAMPKAVSLMRKLISRVSLNTYLTAMKNIQGRGRVKI